MKKIILLIALLAVTGTAYAVNLNANSGIVYSGSYTLLNAVTATGAGTAQSFTKINELTVNRVPVSKHMCTATWGGTTPTSIAFDVEGSEDGTNYGDLATVTMTASPTVFHIEKQSVTYIRGNYNSKVGGDGTTSLTLTCTSGGI